MKEAPSSLSLYRLPNTRPPVTLSDEEFVPQSPFCLVSSGGVRGSCAAFMEREDVTVAVLEEQLDLQQVEERCVGRGCGHVIWSVALLVMWVLGMH